jgi:hypothetical protein
MSRTYETVATVTHDGDEMDVPVRALIGTGPLHGGGWGAVLDGDVEAFVDGEWWPLDSLTLDAGDADRCEEALCDLANEDDSGQGPEADDDGYERWAS